MSAAGEARDDDIEQSDYAVDDGHDDRADAVYDGHLFALLARVLDCRYGIAYQDGADGLADALQT